MVVVKFSEHEMEEMSMSLLCGRYAKLCGCQMTDDRVLSLSIVYRESINSTRWGEDKRQTRIEYH